MELVVASRSDAKIGEIMEILGSPGLTLLTYKDFDGWPDVEETGNSYLENALIKARGVCAFTGRGALADDSGLEVNALGGAPGVHSARWSGPHATDEDNNEKLAGEMSKVGSSKARYRCVAAVAFPNGDEFQTEGVMEGRISEHARGQGGFGYDPWFIPDGSNLTIAEISAQRKHAVSHRGMALRAMASILKEL